MAVLISAVLAAWLALTVARQLARSPWSWSRRFARGIQRHDAFHLVPSFSYFAPNPPSLDFELLYRDRLLDGSLTAWRALRLFSTSPWRAVWNPEKRRYQAVFRRCSTLLQEVRRQVAARRPVEEVRGSDAYVAIARHVAAAPHSIVCEQTQFLVAVSPGRDERKEPAIAFVSPFFRVRWTSST